MFFCSVARVRLTSRGGKAQMRPTFLQAAAGISPLDDWPEPEDRPKCQCVCPCRREPGRNGRRTCLSCARLVGPGCCWTNDVRGICHMCAQGNPQGLASPAHGAMAALRRDPPGVEHEDVSTSSPTAQPGGVCKDCGYPTLPTVVCSFAQPGGGVKIVARRFNLNRLSHVSCLCCSRSPLRGGARLSIA